MSVNGETSSGVVQSPTTLSSESSDKKVLSSNNEYSFRNRLPVPQPEKNSALFWSFLKRCIGKELSKITMPVQWNEPLSLLQRVSEYMTYSHLLHLASACTEPENRMQYMAAFAVSALSPNLGRLGKPFNPLLGETFELGCNGFQLLCEQVGHHPPVSAFHAQSEDFVFRGSLYPRLKFWGKSIEAQPKGILTTELPRWKEIYTWSNVNCVIHNVIVGTLWLEHQGTMEIVNRMTGHRCTLTFHTAGNSSGWFSGSSNAGTEHLHNVEGFIVDDKGKKVTFLYGKWTEFLCAVDVTSLEALLDFSSDEIDNGATNLPKHPPFVLGAVPNSTVLWQASPRPENSESYYNFSHFTMGLNQLMPSADERMKLCATDCRNRPDIRALEEGDLELAVSEKERLENKQREYRKPYKNKKESEWWTPKWFVPVRHKYDELAEDWKYVGGYWGENGAPRKDVPDIF